MPSHQRVVRQVAKGMTVYQSKRRKVVAASLVALIGSVLVAVATPAAADAGPVQMPGTNHWYQYIPGGYTWQQAHDLAVSHTMVGMTTHIATFSSQDELNFVNSLDANPKYYIGARDIGAGDGYTRRWAWTEGPEAGTFFSLCDRDRSGADSGCTNVPGQFTAWFPGGEPTGGGETFAIVGYNWRRDWTDCNEGGCDGYPGVVLEFEPQGSGNAPQETVAPSAIPTLLGPGETMASLSNPRCVYVAPDGRVFVSDYGGGTVYEYVPGQGLRVFVAGIPQAHGLAMTSAGDLLVTGWDTQVLTIVRANGTIDRIGGMPRYSAWVATAADGSVLVSGAYDGIRKYAPDFSSNSYLYQGTAGYFAVLADGRVAASDFLNARTLLIGGSSAPISWPNSVVLGEGLASDALGRLYLADSASNRILTIGQDGVEQVFINTPRPVWDLAVDPTGWLYTMDTGGVLTRYPVKWPVPLTSPAAPGGAVAIAGDAQATVSWTAPSDDGGAPIENYTVIASPGGQTCSVDAPATSCTVTGLENRTRYTFTVTATNRVGTSAPSQPSTAVTPLSPGFQAWTDDQVLSVGGSTTLRFGNALSAASIAVTGGLRAIVPARPDGSAQADITATKTGVITVTGTYILKAAKKATKYTTKTSLYVPKCSGPPTKVKAGKSGSFKVMYAPPGTSVVVKLRDGRVLSANADAAGKASLSAEFSSAGNAGFTVEVSGVAVASGNFSVVR